VWVMTRPPPPVKIPSTRPLRETRVTRLHKGIGMADDQHYDVVIIGTGAGGGTLGHRLATRGLKVLWLERGAFLPRERDNWETQAVFVRGKYLAPEVWYDGHGREFQPEVNYYVGGNTKFYGAALFRLRPEDFGELRHEGGISPAWPISYDDLEPYYSQAEHLYLVHGQHGEDPSEGHASAQYAHPPVSHEPRIQQLNDDLEKLGLHPFHASAVRYRDRTVLFLGGESNHGKSMGQIEACRRGALLVSTETTVIDDTGLAVVGSREPFLKKRTEGTERADKAAPDRGVSKFFGSMPTWEIHTEPSNVDVVVVPAIDGNFDASCVDMIPFERQFQTFHSLQNYLLLNELLAPGIPMPIVDTDPLRRARSDFVQRFSERPFFFVRAATPQVLLDEVDRVL